jgi:hypothetical protein
MSTTYLDCQKTGQRKQALIWRKFVQSGHRDLGQQYTLVRSLFKKNGSFWVRKFFQNNSSLRIIEHKVARFFC